MIDKIKKWCKKICRRTATDFEYFEPRLRAAKPNDDTTAEMEMGKLLYKAWHEDYDNMWAKSRKAKEKI